MSTIILLSDVGRPEFDEVNHLYTFQGRPVPSVSAVIRPLAQDAYGSIDPDILRRAADFGTAVHACTELLDEDDLDMESVDVAWMPYVTAYRKWKEDVGSALKICAIEERLACVRYAGTLDRICEIYGSPWVVDLKTTSVLHPHIGVQLAAYVALAEQTYGKPLRRAALQLRRDGTYRFKEYKSVSDETVFNALLTLHKWRETNK